MGSCEILDLSDAQKWNYYIKQLPLDQQDIYYTPGYYALYENNGDGKAMCFVFENAGEIAIYPFLINSVNELGYDLDDDYYDIQGAYGYNGVVSSTYSKLFINNFYKTFNDYCNKQNIIAEFARFNPILKNHKISEPFMEIIPVMDNVILDLNLEDYLYMAYEHSTRKNIKKANAEGLYVKHIEGINVNNSHIESFIKIYYDTMRRNNAADYYFFKKTYFVNLFHILKKNIILSFAYKNNKEISTEIITFGKQIAYSFLGGTIPDYFKYRANDLLKHEIIINLKSKGFNYYCLGGGELGVIRYKKTFSKNGIVKFYISKKVHNRKVYDEVIRQWEEKKSEHNKVSKNILLRYRNS